LRADDVNTFQQCTISATYSGKSAIHQLIINDNNTDSITIKKCTIRAGRRPIQTGKADSIVCRGDFNVASQALDEASSVNIKIYSAADDFLVYEQNIPISSFIKNRNIYKYKNAMKAGQQGAINSLWFNTGKRTFYLSAKNVDLTGLGCPFYLLININNTSGFGIGTEAVVNGRRSIPILLMSGYTDTLSVTKAKPKISSLEFNDLLTVKGTFTVAGGSNMSGGLTLNWGEQPFIIPGEQFSMTGINRFKCKYTNPDGAVISGDFDFANCLFSVSISHTSLMQSSGTVSFGLTFGDYNQNLETHL
jgi:hypothetical protein